MGISTQPKHRVLAVVGPNTDINFGLSNLLRSIRSELADSFIKIDLPDIEDQVSIKTIFLSKGIGFLVIYCSLPDFPLPDLIDLAIEADVLPENILCIIEGQDLSIIQKMDNLGVEHCLVADWREKFMQWHH